MVALRYRMTLGYDDSLMFFFLIFSKNVYKFRNKSKNLIKKQNVQLIISVHMDKDRVEDRATLSQLCVMSSSYNWFCGSYSLN